VSSRSVTTSEACILRASEAVCRCPTGSGCWGGDVAGLPLPRLPLRHCARVLQVAESDRAAEVSSSPGMVSRRTLSALEDATSAGALSIGWVLTRHPAGPGRL